MKKRLNRRLRVDGQQMRRGLHLRHVGARVADCRYRGDNDRHLLRLTTGHDLVDRYFLDRSEAHIGSDLTDHDVTLKARECGYFEHRLNARLRRQDDRQAVGSVLVAERFLQLAFGICLASLGFQATFRHFSSSQAAMMSSTTESAIA
jgi:hypothetical protein